MIFLLDYDGTIVPIADSPELALIDSDTKYLIENLLDIYKVAIVTGRDFESFREVFGKIPKELYVITSHGLEIYKDDKFIKGDERSTLPPTNILEKKIKDMNGVLLEKKRGGFALHYRMYKGEEKDIKEIFEYFVKRYPPKKIIEGKKILEAIYSESNKGKGIEMLFNLTNWNPKRAVYIGDDTTDFDAFRTIRKLGGKAYFVGNIKPPVGVDGTFKDVDEVILWLKKFIMKDQSP